MHEYLAFIFLGITAGSVYALAGVGLVLTYKTSGIFNLAHGALGTAAAYVFYTLHVQHKVPWPIAVLVSVVFLGPLLGMGFERFGRSLSRTSVVWRIAATAAILISIEGLFTVLYGTSERTFGHFLPTSRFNVAGAYVTWEQVIVVLVSVVAMLGLSAFFRFTRTGVAMQAVVDDPDLLDVAGTNPIRVRRWAWVIGCSFATLSGLLLAPSIELDPTVLTLLIVQAFGAAAIGGFSSIPLTWFGGIAIGVVSSVLTKFGPTGSILGGLPPSLPFLVLFLVLILSPRSRLAIKDVGLLRRPIGWKSPPRAQWAFGAAVLVLLLLVPQFAGFNLSQWTLSLTDVIMFLSLGLLVRTAGQVSLCQISFAAIGAAYFSKFAVGAGIPWLLALVLCGLVVIPVGALLAIPAIRFSGLYLALATFGFGILLQDMFYDTRFMFGFGGTGVTVPVPGVSWLSSARGYYYVVLAITIVFALLTVLLTHSRLGRLLSGISDSRLALSAQGTNVTVTLVVVFCISAFMAAVSGALGAAVLTNVGSDNYSPITSLTYVAVVMILVGQAPWYALMGGLTLALIPIYISARNTQNYLTLTFGLSVVLIALRGHPAQFKWLKSAIDRSWFGGGRTRAQLVNEPQQLGQNGPQTRVTPANLDLQHITMRFGGLLAVNDFSMDVPSGRITGLIGPNGAGKTTALNICSGLIKPTAGNVILDGRSVLRLGPDARARHGIGRTFQQMELFESLSVRENVALGCEGSMAGGRVLTQFVTKPADRLTVEENVALAVQRCGLEPYMETQVSQLTTGQRRLVEVARCMAGPFRVWLLDEPSSGLDRHETEQLGTILRQVADERGIAILLVEHDMSLVMGICDEIFVMDFGRLIFKGSPDEVRSSEDVHSAYLGSSLESEESEETEEPAVVAPSEAGVGGTQVWPSAVTVSSGSNGAALLHLESIEAGYGGTVTLRDIDLVVQPGNIVALLGPNGAGKTTLLRVASGLLRPFKGHVMINGGQDITPLTPSQRAKSGICLVPETRGIFRRLTVRQNLELYIPPWKARVGGDIEPAVAAFPILGARLNQVAGSLSGGEQQMLAVARAYLCSPTVVLADELSMGLAPIVVDEIYESLQRLNNEGVGLLIVEQYVNKVLEMADYVYILVRSQLVWSGRPSDMDYELLSASYLGGEAAELDDEMARQGEQESPVL